jgi:hypothetical protein
MSEFQIRQLLFNSNTIIANQFQFWMAVTFAVVVATYTTGSRLRVWVRHCLATLYIAAVATFYLRYWGAARSFAVQYHQLRQMGADLGGIPQGLPRFDGILRQFVMLAGTVFAVFLIYRPTAAQPPDDDREA